MAKKQEAKKIDSGTPSASFKNEVILWGVLAVSIILFISNFGIAGKVGNALSSVFFGLFGITAYLFPILLFVGTAFFISNKANRLALVKASATIGFFLFMCMFLELITGSNDAKNPMDAYAWSAAYRLGGGFLGGFFTWLVRPNLGTASAYVIDIAALIICMVLITQRSLWIPIQTGGKKMYVSAKNETKRQREQHAQRKQRRIDNKATGVTTNTSIRDTAALQASDNLSELRPESLPVQEFPILMMGQKDGAQAQKEQAPVGMDNQTDMSSFSDRAVLVQDDGPAGTDNIIPITRVSLQPKMPVEAPAGQEPELRQMEVKSFAQEPAEDILANTSELFSDLLPTGEEDPETWDAAREESNDNDYTEHVYTEDGRGIHEENNVYKDESSINETYAGDADEMSLAADVAAILDAEKKDGNADIRTDEEHAADFYDAAVSAEELMEQQMRESEAIQKKAAASAVQASHGTPEQTVSTPRVSAKREKAETAAAAVDVAVRVRPPVKQEYILPSPSLLKYGDPKKTGDSRQHLQETALKLQQTLKNFGVNVTILNVSCGPSVTRFEIQPEMGVKVSKIVNLADDIKLNLAAADIRIEAPIPGKAAIGIEVPNKENVPVMFRDLIESEEFQQQKSPCTFAAGKDIAGQVVVTDICRMPHLLIAGATGSGKSVCINTIIMSILYKADPDDVKIIMIDPKVVELSVYNGIPHLLLPVVTDPKKAAGALHWAVAEMMDRYQKFADYGVRNMKGYNAKIRNIADIPDDKKPQKMPYIVIIVDELADLMMAAPGDVEDAICRLAQLARAAGIHLIIATQRPSVNVITGLIKANMPSRIAFSVTSGIDSRTILDMNGAEKLLGKGDMLFYPQGYQKPIRVQGAFVSDAEVSEVVQYVTEQNGVSQYSSELEAEVTSAAGACAPSADDSPADDRDTYFADAAKLLIDKDKASVSMLQRYFKIGFNRAARIMDQLEEAGIVGPEEGTKPRKILMTADEFAQYEEETLL